MKKKNNTIIQNLPTELNILSRIYKIEYFDSMTEVDAREEKIALGQVDLHNKVIRIYLQQGRFPDILRELIHEILHVLVYELKIDFVDDREEKVIDNLAVGFMDLLIRNNIFGTEKK